MSSVDIILILTAIIVMIIGIKIASMMYVPVSMHNLPYIAI